MIYSKNTDEPLDKRRRVTNECRQMQMSADESLDELDECRRVTRRV